MINCLLEKSKGINCAFEGLVLREFLLVWFTKQKSLLSVSLWASLNNKDVRRLDKTT